MGTEAAVAVLLVGRVVAITFIVLVIQTQRKAIRKNIYPELQGMRRLLLSISVVLLLGNILPVVVAAMALLGSDTDGVLLPYAFSNNGSSMIVAILLWATYKFGDVDED